MSAGVAPPTDAPGNVIVSLADDEETQALIKNVSNKCEPDQADVTQSGKKEGAAVTKDSDESDTGQDIAGVVVDKPQEATKGGKKSRRKKRGGRKSKRRSGKKARKSKKSKH